MATPHFDAEPDDFASTVLFPGDPLRAKFIAETYFDELRQVTSVRNMFGYTGTYNGKPISVQGSGMGVPSASIYATELVQHYGVDTIVRVGSCGALRDEINLGDLIVANAAGTDSMVNRTRMRGRDIGAAADFDLLRKTADTADRLAIPIHVGRLFTSDLFYDPTEGTFELLEQYGFLGVEMEAAGLYGLAAELGFKALAVVTVSDHVKREEAMSSQDRQTTFDTMIRLVLESVTA